MPSAGVEDTKGLGHLAEQELSGNKNWEFAQGAWHKFPLIDEEDLNGDGQDDKQEPSEERYSLV